MLTECEADRAALARLNDSQRLRDVVERANRATVTFYPVHRLALTGPADAPSLRGAARAEAGDAAARLDSLQQLAADTDGVSLLRAADTELLVGRLEDDLRSYYLIRYRSTNGRLDGRFRTITVRVLRQGMAVRTRRGYRGLTPNDLVAESTASARASGPESAPVLDARAPFRTRTSVWSAPDGDGTASVWLVGELDYALRKELVWTAGARARIQVVGVDGAEIAASELAVPAADGSFSFRLPESGGLPPGEYAVRVELQPVSGAAAPLTATVRLVVPRNATVLGEAVLSRRGPSTGLRHAMTADVRFQRNERIRVEMPTGVEGVATARMLDRLGNPMQVPVQVSMREDSSGLFRWVVADAVLAPLARGEYAIEVSLAGARDYVAFSVVP
jgi:hypothetical protein